MDGICPPEYCMIGTYDDVFNRVGKYFMDVYCAGDAFCASKLEIPLAATEKAFVHVDRQDHCPQIYKYLTREKLRKVLAGLLIRANYRMFIPPVVYRLLRCNAVDVDILTTFFKRAGVIPHSSQTQKQTVYEALGTNIKLAEMLSNQTVQPPSPSSRRLIQETALFSPDVSLLPSLIYPHWPVYKYDQYYGKYTNTSIPVIMMNGDLDPQTGTCK